MPSLLPCPKEGYPGLAPSHWHHALSTLFETRDRASLTSIAIKGPPVSHFELTPSIDLEALITDSAPIGVEPSHQSLGLSVGHVSTGLKSLCIMGTLANSVYRQLISVLQHKDIGCSLSELRVQRVHEWSRVMSADEVRDRRERRMIKIQNDEA